MLKSRKALKKMSKPFKSPYKVKPRFVQQIKFAVEKTGPDGKKFMGYETLPVLVF